MMKLQHIALPICALLVACAQPQIWLRDNTTEQQFNQDKAVCEYEAAKSANQRDPSFRSGLGQELDIANRRSEITTLCLKSKGYVLKKN